jgi:trimeric autotransporter adhesin
MRRIKPIICLLALHVLASVSLAQNNVPVRYFYDDLGRLIRVIDQNGNLANYNYDAVGNLLSITRSTVPTNNGLAILSFSPQKGSVGQVVILQGQGFSTTTGANTVQFNGTAATVTGASANSLTVTVPSGATTGPLSVTVSGVTATSDTNFTVTVPTLLAIAVSPPTAAVGVGAAQPFTATGTFSNGSTQDLTASVLWSSSSSAATVSNAAGSQGIATGVSNGLARITATSGTVSGSAVLKVAALTAVTIAPSSISLPRGVTQRFEALAFFDDGTNSDVTSLAAWSSSNPNVATISNSTGLQGLVTTLVNGSTTISASYGGFTSSAPLNVLTLTSLSVSPANTSIPKGTNQQFNVIATFSDGSTTDVTTHAAWASSNPPVARISSVPGTLGLGTAVSAGNATITATYTGMSGLTALTVTPPAPTSVAISPASPLVPLGGTLQLKATAQLTDGTSSDVTTSANWSSSNGSVATVSNTSGRQGLVTGIFGGTATITATFGNLSASAPTTVVGSQIYQGTVYAADGQTPGTRRGGRTVKIYDVATGTLLASATSSNIDGFYQATGNPPGSQGVSVQTSLDECSGKTVSASGSANGGQPIIVNLTLPLAIVSGKISFYDGTPVAFADIFLTADQSCYGDSALNTVAVADTNGNYRAFAELTVGTFTVFAQDNSNTGLMSSVTGSLSSLATPIVVDVSLPPTGTVTGAIFDSTGNALTQGTVQLYSSISEFAKTVRIPSGNRYQFDQVPVGTLVVTASPQTMGPFDVLGASIGTLGTGGQQVTLNVNLQPTSSVQGTVFDTDGVTPVASAHVTIENPSIGGGIADFYDATQVTDAFGKFSLPTVPIGTLRVAATGAGNVAGVVTGTLTQNNTLTINPVFGNAVNLPGATTYNLNDVNSFIFDIDCFGEPVNGGYPGSGTNVAYSDGAFPYLNSGQPPYCASDPATLDLSGRQLIFGPRPMAGNLDNGFSGTQSILQAGRKVFVPQNGGFARYLEILTNPLSTPVTTTFEVDSYFRPFYDTLAVDPATNGNTFSVVTASAQPNAETLAFAFGGGTSLQATSGLSLFQDAFTYKWTVTVPPNQTVILMHFLVQRAPGDITGATSQAQALVNLTDPNALIGMTAQEKAEVINFNVP